MTKHKVVSPEAWLEARKRLLAKEKTFTRLRDELGTERRELPWVRVDKTYVFEGAYGRETLPELFGGRSQLVAYYFMFGPEVDDAPCKSCSFWADSFERNVVHLNARDVTLLAVSHAPLDRLEAFKNRMGWTFKWVSSEGNDFNYDYNVSFRPDATAKVGAGYNYVPKTSSMTELPGISVFYKDADDTVFHTYSCYARGLDMMNVAYQYLDLVPEGRDEADQQPHAMAWVRAIAMPTPPDRREITEPSDGLQEHFREARRIPPRDRCHSPEDARGASRRRAPGGARLSIDNFARSSAAVRAVRR